MTCNRSCTKNKDEGIGMKATSLYDSVLAVPTHFFSVIMTIHCVIFLLLYMPCLVDLDAKGRKMPCFRRK